MGPWDAEAPCTPDLLLLASCFCLKHACVRSQILCSTCSDCSDANCRHFEDLTETDEEYTADLENYTPSGRLALHSSHKRARAFEAQTLLAGAPDFVSAGMEGTVKDEIPPPTVRFQCHALRVDLNQSTVLLLLCTLAQAPIVNKTTTQADNDSETSGCDTVDKICFVFARLDSLLMSTLSAKHRTPFSSSSFRCNSCAAGLLLRFCSVRSLIVDRRSRQA